MNLRDIAVKLLSGELPPISPEELSRERLKVCADCEHMSKISRQCRQCGCFLDLKARLLEAHCPIGKW